MATTVNGDIEPKDFFESLEETSQNHVNVHQKSEHHFDTVAGEPAIEGQQTRNTKQVIQGGKPHQAHKPEWPWKC